MYCPVPLLSFPLFDSLFISKFPLRVLQKKYAKTNKKKR